MIRQKDDEFIFPVADGTTKLSGRDYEFREPTLTREPTLKSEDFSRELQGESGESQPAESTDDAEARADFWSIQGDFIYRHLDTLNVTRSTHADLDVLQEKRIDDNWNVDSNRHLSESCRGFTKCTPLKEETSKRIYVVRGEMDINSIDYQIKSWTEVWTKIGKAAQKREKQEWAKLNNARRLRGIYFIDPNDEEYKEILKNAKRKLERDPWHQPRLVQNLQKSITKVCV